MARNESIKSRPFRTLAFGTILLGVFLAANMFLQSYSCSSWQEDYKRFMYSETLKNSPVLYGPGDIESIIGTRPVGCSTPRGLSSEDIRTFQSEGVGPNHFVNEFRSAYRKTNS